MYRDRASRWLYVLVAGTSLVAVLPLAWLLLVSLRNSQAIAASSAGFTLSNYAVVLFQSMMPRYFLNTTIVAAFTVAATLVCACLGAYAASRYRFRGRESILVAILAASMTPVIAILVPLYLYAASLHMLNTYRILVVVFIAWQLPGSLWLLRSFIDMVPVEVEEAAQVDGCSRLGAFARVILPQLLPGLLAVGLIVFVYVWNEFIIAVSLSSRENMRIASVGLYFYISEFGIEWGHIAAAAILTLVPPAVAFLFMQRHLVNGLSAGALK